MQYAARYIFSLATSNLAQLSQADLDDECSDDTAQFFSGGSASSESSIGSIGTTVSISSQRKRKRPMSNSAKPSASSSSSSASSCGDGNDSDVEVLDMTGDDVVSIFSPKTGSGAVAAAVKKADERVAKRKEQRRKARALLRTSTNDAVPSMSVVEDGNISFHNEVVIRRLELQCSICLEPMHSAVSANMPYVTECGHIYHKLCIKQAMLTPAVRSLLCYASLVLVALFRGVARRAIH